MATMEPIRPRSAQRDAGSNRFKQSAATPKTCNITTDTSRTAHRRRLNQTMTGSFLGHCSGESSPSWGSPGDVWLTVSCYTQVWGHLRIIPELRTVPGSSIRSLEEKTTLGRFFFGRGWKSYMDGS